MTKDARRPEDVTLEATRGQTEMTDHRADEENTPLVAVAWTEEVLIEEEMIGVTRARIAGPVDPKQT